MKKRLTETFLILLLMSVPFAGRGMKPAALAWEISWHKSGIASWYGEENPGINARTASGEVFDDAVPACASWEFPFGTHLKVTNRFTGRSVICRVNDRGPAKRLGRAIDLTRSAFGEIARPEQGLAWVSIIPVGGRPRQDPSASLRASPSTFAQDAGG